MVLVTDYRDTAVDGAVVLDQVHVWFGRFIAMPNPDDLYVLTLWAVATHVAAELYTSPRLLIDSTMPGSGKTTVLDHLQRLAHRPIQAASLSSPALLPRLLEHGIRTLLLDEVDRSLRPGKPGVEDLIGILNSGYRRGATRPVLVPASGGTWQAREMPTFAPVAMAGNSPNLPDDTRSRAIRILLMPDLDGTVEDSDWELIEDDALALHEQIAAFCDQIRDQLPGMAVELPDGCVGRVKEKWRPLKRIAVAAGGHWPAIADGLIARGLDEEHAEREAGLKTLPPGMVLLTDVHTVFPTTGTELVPTSTLVAALIRHNPDYWGPGSPYGKALTEHRLGRLMNQAANITSQRPGGRGPRGYLRAQLEPVWHRLGLGRFSPGASGSSGATGTETHHMYRDNQMHRPKTDTPQPVRQAGAPERLCALCACELLSTNTTDTCAECAFIIRNTPDPDITSQEAL